MEGEVESKEEQRWRLNVGFYDFKVMQVNVTAVYVAFVLVLELLQLYCGVVQKRVFLF